MNTPVWYRLAQVDEALTRHAAHLRIARASGRPFAQAVHWPRVDALLELRSALTAELAAQDTQDAPTAANGAQVGHGYQDGTTGAQGAL